MLTKYHIDIKKYRKLKGLHNLILQRLPCTFLSSLFSYECGIRIICLMTDPPWRTQLLWVYSLGISQASAQITEAELEGDATPRQTWSQGNTVLGTNPPLPLPCQVVILSVCSHWVSRYSHFFAHSELVYLFSC